MDDQVTPALAQSSAARAFEDLRGEVSLLRRATEGLSAERRNQPDYGPTLEALATSNQEIRDWARKVSERPAVRLTPLQIGEQIEEAVTKLRADDRRQLDVAHGQLTSALHEAKMLLATARVASEQVRREKIIGGLSFLAGMVLLMLLVQIELVWR
jgi:hypothetical protein